MEPRDLEHLAEEIRQLRSSVDELSQLLRTVFNIKSAAGPTPAKRKKPPTRKQQASRKIDEGETRDPPPPPGRHF